MDHFYYLETAETIAKEAGDILLSFWGKLHHIKEKNSYWDLVTEADLASEKHILKKLSEKFKDHEILSEEAGLSQQKNSHFQWFIDPLDGTTNFTHQYPMISVSMGLLINGIPTVGVIYNPVMNELFLGLKDKVATLNGKDLKVSSVSTLDKSLLATGFAYDRHKTEDRNYKEFCHITQNTQGVRRGGSAALDLAYVAAGRLDGYWERGLKPWDIAAGIVLVREAGGNVTSYDNGPLDLYSGRILATNGHIHGPLSEELLKAAKISSFSS